MTTEKLLFPELSDNQRRLMPEGFRYEEDIISEADEAALAKSLATLDLKPFEFHGHLGNRRVTSFGLRYDYARRNVEAADAFPFFVVDLRYKVAKFLVSRLLTATHAERIGCIDLDSQKGRCFCRTSCPGVSWAE